MTEKELIVKLKNKFDIVHNQHFLIKGIGDDCAVVLFDETHYYLLSVDSMNENVHFDPIYTPWRHLGFKLLTRGVSDVYAMNGIPKGFLFQLAVSNRYDDFILEEIQEGLKEAANYYKVDILGGDISTILKGAVFSVTVIGTVEKRRIAYRKGAKPGDVICVSGDLGAPYAGFKILEREKMTFLEDPTIQPDLSEFPYVIEKCLRPIARKDLIEGFLLEDIIPTSMIDISDGLAMDLYNLYERNGSGIGFIIFLEKIPIDPETIRVADLFEEDAVHYALFGGDEYQLLMTLDPDSFELVKKEYDLTPIGYVTDKVEGVFIQNVDNQLEELPKIGWDHFDSKYYENTRRN